MIASFQDEDPGLDHQAVMPEGIPDPESLPSAADVLHGINHPAADVGRKPERLICATTPPRSMRPSMVTRSLTRLSG
jgi:acyl-CoA thioesterase